MKVALITDGIWPYVLGGMQKHSYYVCKYLAQHHIEVHLFHFNQSKYAIEQLEFFSDEERKYIHATIIDFPKSLPFPGHYLYNSYRYSKRVYTNIQNKLGDYDFIYTKGFSGWHLINQKYFKKISAPPIAVKFHGYEMFQKPPDLKTKWQHMLLLRRPVQTLSKRADIVFSYGGKITELIESLGVNTANIVELPSGVEAAAISDSIGDVHTPLRFLFLGRYERRKGVEELNQALRLALESGSASKFEMHFVGPIPADKQIQSPGIFYHGEIRDKTELQTKIRDCDVLICPSWSEGFPNVLLEAMAQGLTVIATNVGAINVLVNANNGFLIETSESSEILYAIHQVLATSKEQLQLKKQAAQACIKDHFVWEKLIQRLINTIVKS